jgi:hypothetical protein
VEKKISGRNMEALVDMGETHIFVSERVVKSLHQKPENCIGMCKLLKSSLMSVTWIVR